MSVLSAERPREHNVIKQLKYKLKFECNFNLYFNFWLELQASRAKRGCVQCELPHTPPKRLEQLVVVQQHN